MTDDEMLAATAWFNLSETTFVTHIDKASNTYDVRIFTIGQELPFAGHPTIGTAAAVRQNYLPSASSMTQMCRAGPVDVRFDKFGTIHLVAPHVAMSDLTEAETAELVTALGTSGEIITSARVDTGPIWLTVLATSASAVVDAKPDFGALTKLSREHGATGIQIAALGNSGSDWKVRTFAPIVGVPEDPVCGSGNVAVAAVRRRAGLGGDNYRALQGQEVGRDGAIQVRYLEDERIEVGGEVFLTASGKLAI
jgi:PhzF family phenazine biosynthesis protein